MEDSTAPHLVAVPYPGRGHVNPMMNLCEQLASRGGARVTFVVTEEWLGFIRSSPRHHQRHPNIRLRSIPNVIPFEQNRAADFSGFLDAVYTRMEAPFEDLLARLDQEAAESGEHPVAGIVADTYLPWAVRVGVRREVPVYSLFPMSAAFFSVLRHLSHLPLVDVSEHGDQSWDCVPGITALRFADIRTLAADGGRPLRRALEAFSWVNKAKCLLFTSFYELEANVVDALRAELSFPVYPVGPSIPYTALLQKDNEEQEKEKKKEEEDYYTWLDSQPSRSVLYVSLGSFLSVSAEQMDEIAMGLHISGVRFLWVVRRDQSRMRELAGGNAGVVVAWCDQLRVLCHPSVGGFLTHCGWNSTLEGVFAGVPMVTFPIFWDQHLDGRMVVEEWKVGLTLAKGRDGIVVVGREEISGVVKRLMGLDGADGGEESSEMWRRASELREVCRRAVGDDGSSVGHLDAFLREVGMGGRPAE